ncbi:ADP-ribosylation factor-like protein 16 [Tigriopus californicus]|uniref:ADP-ribosylation factor-like protein 16 n=1 Tax=Tigriopus californicus TaxID=6832 RepID=UPI0027DA8564|nr:ADP-ribosylation factor-like protein 16 [Tigriopus californicus]
MVVFVVGAEQAGKTLLCLKLSTSDRDEYPSPKTTKTQSTVGVNHFNVDFNVLRARHQSRKNQSQTEPRVVVKELGGQLCQNWLAYFGPDIRDLIFVIDVSDLSVIARIGVHLLECLNHFGALKESTRVLIVYSKIDLVTKDLNVHLRRVRNILRLTYLFAWYQTIDFQEVTYSAYEDQGLPYIKNWLRLLD